jgi:carbamoyltransferase
MIIAGISALHHDAAAAVVDSDNGEILFAAHSERYSRKKNDAKLCPELVAELRRYAPERLIFYEKPVKKALRRALHFDFSFAREESPSQHLRRLGLDLPLEYADHHEAHAAAGAFTSPFDEAAVLVIDAIGEFETTSIWRYQAGKLTRLFSRRYPQSIGLFYSAFTQAAGFRPNEEEYILMGLSAYGTDSAYEELLADSFDLSDDFPVLRRNYHQGVVGERFRKLTPAELARATQRVFETVLERALAFTRRITGQQQLVFMGGCALNCLANRLLKRHFSSVWTMPNPGDAGSSLGAAALLAGRKLSWRTPYLGRNIPGDYPVAAALSVLLQNRCVGVASGRAEFGPRAFGNRSLFADPRGDSTKDNVNLIKKREPFRPFAPVVLEEHFAELFDADGDARSPYMQCVYRTRQPERYPAITHADGSSRVQTVTREQHPGLHELLSRFYAATGCPMLLNTSLNIKGMPLVNDEHDAQRFAEQYGVTTLGASRAVQSPVSLPSAG